MLMDGIVLPLSNGGDSILVLTNGGSTPEPRGSKGAGSGPRRCYASGGVLFSREKSTQKRASSLRAGPPLLSNRPLPDLLLPCH